ncbi:MAG: hypothetical protein IKL54_06795, partial [Bacteroidaceae bacterium]|nr:hypothetical protein [Bacteroidaceae bacterium]
MYLLFVAQKGAKTPGTRKNQSQQPSAHESQATSFVWLFAVILSVPVSFLELPLLVRTAPAYSLVRIKAFRKTSVSVFGNSGGKLVQT